MHSNHVSQLRLATGGRTTRLQVYSHLADTYQDSGLLGALMDGSLDAPERMPAGAARADDYRRCGAMQQAARMGVAS